MRHIVTLKNNREFGKVYNQKESFANKYLVMYLRANNLDYSRIGISVSKKVGNSVVRHRLTEVAEGEKEWTGMMDSFYKGFHPLVDKTIHSKTEHKVGERVLGTDPVSGKPVSVKIGRFGPVIQIGTADDEEKPRFAQLAKGLSMETITLEEALDAFKLPRTLGDYDGHTVTVGVGRFGPYVRYDKLFVSIPKGTDPMEISLDRQPQRAGV